EHQSDRSEADNRDGISRLDVAFFQAAHDAGQRFDQGSVLIADMSRNLIEVLLNNPGGYADELGVGAIVEKKVITEIFQVTTAVVTMTTRGRIRRHYPLSNAKIRHSLAYTYNVTCQFVTK